LRTSIPGLLRRAGVQRWRDGPAFPRDVIIDGSTMGRGCVALVTGVVYRGQADRPVGQLHPALRCIP